eukprot:XP_016663068.1 PREDICTED: uncharacterized protein LOC107884775 [Acyrthosiphon pisum]
MLLITASKKTPSVDFREVAGYKIYCRIPITEEIRLPPGQKKVKNLFVDEFKTALITREKKAFIVKYYLKYSKMLAYTSGRRSCYRCEQTVAVPAGCHPGPEAYRVRQTHRDGRQKSLQLSYLTGYAQRYSFLFF